MKGKSLRSCLSASQSSNLQQIVLSLRRRRILATDPHVRKVENLEAAVLTQSRHTGPFNQTAVYAHVLVNSSLPDLARSLAETRIPDVEM